MKKTTTPQHTRRNSGAPSSRRATSSSQSKPKRTATRKPHGRAHSPRRRTPQTTRKAKQPVRKVDNRDVLKIIPLGGCEEVGRNCTLFEYQGDIIVLDMGLQFPEEDMPGIDYIIPNLKYLEGREKDVKGVILSHGHLDHIGAAPIMLQKLGYPVVIARDLTLAMTKYKVEDHQKGATKNMKTIRINSLDDVIRLGKFTIKFFQVEHSIMDAVGVVVETPAGSAIHPGDWTLDRDKNGVSSLDYTPLRDVKKPSVLMLESLGVLHDHRGVSYEDMYKNLMQIIEEAPGRVIIGTFSSQIERVKWVIDAAIKMNKKIFLDGYSMKVNVGIAQELGYMNFKKSIIKDIKTINKYDQKDVVVVCTGAQGESNAVLSRIVNGTHRFMKLSKEDTVVFSSSIIPGNERTIQRLKDNMYRQCENVIHSQIMDVHVSGHATKTDILEVIDMVQPSIFMPVYANHFMLKETERLAYKNGYPRENIIVPDNGSIIEVSQKGTKMLKEKVPSDYVFVDGLGVSDTQHIVLRDRQVLAEDGMVVVIATVDSKRGTLTQNPDIISRGFVFLKDNRKLIEDVRHSVKRMVIESKPSTWADTNQIRNDIRDKIGQFLMKKTGKRPMVLPVVIEV